MAVLAALPFALVGTAQAATAAAPNGAAIIYNPGNGDFTGFRIVVERSGDAWATDGAGSESGQLQPAITQALFADLAAVPLAEQPVRACGSSQAIMGGTSIWLNLGFARNPSAQRAPNIECAFDPRAARLFADAAAIQRAMYVNAYRTRAMLVFGARGGYLPISGAAAYLAPNGSAAYSAPSGAGYLTPSGSVNYGPQVSQNSSETLNNRQVFNTSGFNAGGSLGNGAFNSGGLNNTAFSNGTTLNSGANSLSSGFSGRGTPNSNGLTSGGLSSSSLGSSSLGSSNLGSSSLGSGSINSPIGLGH